GEAARRVRAGRIGGSSVTRSWSKPLGPTRNLLPSRASRVHRTSLSPATAEFNSSRRETARYELPPRSMIHVMAEANRASRPAVPRPGAYLAWAVARLLRATTETPSQFAERANARAGRRRSLWNLLLLPAAICPFAALWYATARVLETLYTLCHNTPSSTFL